MSESTPVLMPRLGETVVEGTVAQWYKAPGESVARLEPLLSISTDKIDTDIPSPASGTLLAIHVAAGETVAVGTLLALIGDPAAAATETAAVAEAAAAHAPAPVADAPVNPLHPETVAARPAGRTYISPVVKRLAREHGVDPSRIAGTGLGGRVTRKDLLGAIAPDAAADEFVQPLTTMRRAIAQHMVQSVKTSPHVATIFEVDMTAVVRHREAHKAALAAEAVKLSYTPYFVAACAAALQAHPLVNSRYTEAGIVTARSSHIGVAVALANGLLVPVIRNANERSLAELARTLDDLATRARTGTLTPDELMGGTFTVTNHGVGGSLIGTPIINQPQAAILGVGAIVKRPVVQSRGPSLLPSADDAIVIRPMCYLTLSFDHRILDGAAADAFMAAVKAALEGWEP